MDSRDELIERAERGRRVAGFLSDPHIATIYQDTMKQLRADINSLQPHQQMEFTIGQSSAQTLERFWGGLQGVVEIGAEAEGELMEESEAPEENDHRGIL